MNRTWMIATLAAVAAAAAIGGNDAEGSATLLNELHKGNQRFTTGINQFPRLSADRRIALANAQTPFATVLTCSDSRVPPELIFDQGLGDLFVVRVAGNVADTDEIGTIEYGVGHLKTRLLIVMGHSHCGAVKAVVDEAQVSQNIRWLVDNIKPAVARVKDHHPKADKAELVEFVVEENVRQAISDILKRSKEVRERFAEGELTILGAVYELETGRARWLGANATGAK